MPQIAGLRGVMPDAARLAAVIAAPLVGGLASGALVDRGGRDPGRSVYRYHQLFAGPAGRTFTRKNLICAVRLSPWSEGNIRPHEATTPALREAELARIRADRGHVAPFLAGFRDPPQEVERLLRKSEGGRPNLDVTTADGTIHRVWRVQDAELLGKLRHYFAPKKLHVLEGHDRYEAMLAYRDELATSASLTMYSSANYGLMCLTNFDDPALRVAPPVTLEQVHHTVELGATLPAGSTVFVPPLAAGLVSAIIDRDEDLV